MRRKALMIAAVAVGFVAFTSLAHAIPIVNGSFEADDWIGHQYDLETAGLTGWLALDPGNNSPYYPWGVDNSEFGATPWGDQFVVIGGYGADLGTSIQQTVSGLTVGATYSLNFGISTEAYLDQDRTGAANVLVNMLAGSSTASQVFSAPMSVHWYWDTWVERSYLFVADAETVTFAFEDQAMTGEGYDIGIDNVSMTAVAEPVPEPGTLVLLGLGLAGAGMRLRRKIK